jgi:hypothetical protein
MSLRSCKFRALFCRALARSKVPMEFAGGYPHLSSEGLRKVALVRESCINSYFRKRAVRCGEFAGGEVDPQPAQVVAQGRAEMATKGACEMGLVDVNGRGDLAKRKVVSEPVVHQVASPQEPAWSHPLRVGPPVTTRFSKDFKREPLHGEHGGPL